MPRPSFPSVPANNTAMRGQLAVPKQRFGEHGRYAVAPVHTRFEAVEWFVWDAGHPAAEERWRAGNGIGSAEVIRQCATLEEALEGLGA